MFDVLHKQEEVTYGSGQQVTMQHTVLYKNGSYSSIQKLQGRVYAEGVNC